MGDGTDPWTAAVALVVSGAAGRFIVIALMAWVPPVEAREGLSKTVGQDADAMTALQSAVWASPVFIWGAWVDWRSLVIAAVLLAIFAVWFRRLLMRRIGGVTGDCLGFAAYVGIVVTTLAFARLA